MVTCPAALYVPSAFSPNHDSRNDVFHVTYTAPEGLDGFKMIIYDRWGQLLFESNAVEQGWMEPIREVRVLLEFIHILFYSKSLKAKLSRRTALTRGW